MQRRIFLLSERKGIGRKETKYRAIEIEYTTNLNHLPRQSVLKLLRFDIMSFVHILVMIVAKEYNLVRVTFIKATTVQHNCIIAFS